MIPGATIQELEHAWKADYGHYTNPMDVVLVAGLNNILRGETEEQIMSRFYNFMIAVAENSRKHHNHGHSSFAVATLIYPPKLTWFDEDGQMPYPESTNKIEMMKSLNNKIINFNNALRLNLWQPKTISESGPADSSAPKFHHMGIETVYRRHRGRIIRKTKHDWRKWRHTEQRPLMLHLNDKERAKMGRIINYYFASQIHQNN